MIPASPTDSIPAAPLPEAWCRKHLTPAEQRVVGLVASGLSTKEAALRLNKSTATVRNQLYEAMRKLDVRTRYELIALLRPSLPAGGAVIAAKGMPTPPAPELLEYAI